MSRVLVVAGSSSAGSRSSAVATIAAAWLADAGHDVRVVELRDLPADDLVHLRAESPPVADTVAALEAARGVVLATPVYKAAYSGLLKLWLDLLPQLALGGKVVLPLMTGGSTAHVLALDYALRPVLQSMAPAHVLSGWHFVESQLVPDGDGGFALEPAAETKLRALVAELSAELARAS